MLTKTGTRVIYDKTDNRIVSILHRVDGGIERQPIGEIAYIDIPYDDFNPLTHDIVGVENGVGIFEALPTYETEEQKQIRELEDALLLQTENEIGGIL